MATKHALFLSIGLLLGMLAPAQEKSFPVPTGNNNQLFYLQRTSNTNTLVYELNLRNGVPDLNNPVQVMWIRYQEKGQRQELSYIQKKFAYGLHSRRVAENQYELSFVSYKKYKMYLKKGADNKFNVYATINQHPVILTNIFVKINGGSFWTPNIEFVEISGIDPVSHLQVKERLKI